VGEWNKNSIEPVVRLMLTKPAQPQRGYRDQSPSLTSQPLEKSITVQPLITGELVRRLLMRALTLAGGFFFKSRQAGLLHAA
jgi:hypothetical protein